MAKKKAEGGSIAMTKYNVTIELIEDMLGTVPMNKEIYTDYIAAKAEKGGEDVLKEALKEADTVPEGKAEEKGWTSFHQDEKGLLVYDYFIKGFIKNAANILKDQLDTKALRSKIGDFVFVSPRKIYLDKEKADGVLERPLRAMTAQGPRVSLARSNYVEAGTQLSFVVTLLPHKELTEALLRSLFSYGEFCGLGQFRNGGYGRFSLVSFEEVV